MAKRYYMESNKIILTRWVDQALDHPLTKQNIKSRFKATYIWPYNPKAMDNKTQASNIYIIAPNNERCEKDYMSYEQPNQEQ